MKILLCALMCVLCSPPLLAGTNEALRVGTYNIRFASGDRSDASASNDVACPEDFDAFWRNAVDRLEDSTPLDLKMEHVPSLSRKSYDYFRINFATAGRRMWGFLTVPTGSTKARYPVHVYVPGAGPYHSKWWGGCGDAITMLVNVLDFDPCCEEGIKKGYEAMCSRLQRVFSFHGAFGLAGMAESREATFYYSVILGMNRIANWAWNRKDVDRDHFTVIGGSQGGYLALALMAMNGKFTRGAVYVPAMGDLLGDEEGRVSGWPRPLKGYPNDRWDAIRRIAPYFDAVNFASRVKTPLRGARGLADGVCSPSSTKLIFDAVASKEKYVIDCPGMTHKVFPEIEADLNAWVRSRTLRVDESAKSAAGKSVKASGEFHEAGGL
ncbi:MAG: acetylxylan esterase [Lentisphaerae bacterium]|nr:acetylxylan esterase [Lentisphaerota bacterium]